MGNAQLRVVNPLVRDRIGALPAQFALPTQSVQFGVVGVCGLSSFGFSGTIAHAVLHSPPQRVGPFIGSSMAQTSHLSFKRRSLAWQSARTLEPASTQASSVLGPPLLGSLRSNSASELIWEHSFSTHELSFFRGHRVGKVPLLPGTCYIEFVRIVVVAIHGLQLYSLDDVAFHSIMFLDDDAQVYGAPLVRVQLNQERGTLEISSKCDDSARTKHADMLLRLRSESTSPARVNVEEAQAQCVDTVTGDTFYAATGNDYRGEFRALKQGWAGAGLCLSLVEYERKETEHMHLRACAFLDACSHAGLWWEDHRRRPFFAAGVPMPIGRGRVGQLNA